MIPALAIFLAIASVISCPFSTIIAFVVGSIIFLAEYLPTILCSKLSTIVPDALSTISATFNPATEPQSSSFTMMSCTTSTSLLVK